MFTMYFAVSLLRKKYLKKYKLYNILTNALPLIFFVLLFFVGFKNDSQTISYSVRVLLIIFLSIYCLYQIYKDIRILLNDKKM